MKKMKDYLRKVTAGLLLVAMSSGSVGVNTVSAATDDDNDPSTTTDIIPEAVERGTLSIQIDNAGGSIVVTTQSSDGKENTQTIRKENDKTTITDANGNVTTAEPENSYDLVLEADKGTVVKTKVTSDDGNYIATYRVTTDAGADDVDLPEKTQEYSNDIAVEGDKILEIAFQRSADNESASNAAGEVTSNPSENAAETTDTVDNSILSTDPGADEPAAGPEAYKLPDVSEIALFDLSRSRAESKEVTISTMGFAHYGGRSVPIFIIDNKRAFCMQQEKHTPDHNGYTNSGVANPFDNNLARTVLYYGESGQGFSKGPLAGMGQEEAIIRTTFALNYAYNGNEQLAGEEGKQNGIDLAKPILDFAKAHLIESTEVAFSKTKATAYIDSTDGKQRTPDITLNANDMNSVTMKIPQGVYIHLYSPDREYTNQNVTINGGQKFFLFAKAGTNPGKTYSTGELGASMNDSQAMIVDTGDDSVQHTTYIQMFPNTSSTSLTVTWLQQGEAKVIKKSANESLTNGNSCYSLEGAEFALIDSNGKQVATAKTNAKGVADFGKVDAGTYKVKEISAPEGFELNTEMPSIKVEPEKTAEVTMTDEPLNDPAVITINKVDSEGNKDTSKDLSGTEFTVKYYNKIYEKESDLPEKATKTWVIKAIKRTVGGKDIYRAQLSETCKVKGDDFYLDANGSPILPLGTITIEETSAVKGYNKDNNFTNGDVSVKGKFFGTIQKKGDAVVLHYGDTVIAEDGFTASDNIIRGDLHFYKIDDDGSAMANIPFLITNNETKESHVVLSNKDGVVDTSEIAHTTNTNGLDKYQDGKKITDESKLSGQYGTWFGDGTVNKDRGALQYGTYSIRELACKGNYGKDLIETTVTVDSEKTNVSLNPQVNHTIVLKTTAKDTTTGTHSVPVGEKATVVDTVKYSGLKVGRTYTLKGQLVRKDDRSVIATGEQTFTAEKSSGTVNITFSFESSKLKGKSLVAFEHLYWDGIEVQAHEDINDTDQTVTIPSLKTVAKDDATADQSGVRSKNDKITDTVSYTGLAYDKEYVVRGTLVNQSTGRALTGADGKAITASKNFHVHSKEGSGSVDVTFNWDSSDFEGTAVITQTMYLVNDDKSETKVAEATDLSDANEMVYYPSIRTNAADSQTKDHVGLVGQTTIIDHVTYKNLIPGKEYTVSGKLMDKDTGKALLVNGKEITATTTFKPTAKDGTVDLTYKLDASVLEDKTVVVFEDLIHNKINVTSHADINDEEQSVHYPKVRTTAKDHSTKDDVGTSSKEARLVDTVSYSNLIVGQKYTIKGTLMDKETGKAIEQNGKAVTAETSFTATAAQGSVDLTFVYDSSVLEGKTTVAYEKLYHNEKDVARHEDINDAGQTVQIPKIQTTATSVETGDQVGTIGKEVQITDVVSYKNLVVGKEYTISGKAMIKPSGSEQAVPAKDKDGKDVVQSVTFKATKANGEVSLTFTLDSSNLKNRTVVIFEELLHNGVTVTTHADINDDKQSVYFPEIRTNAVDKQTNDGVGTVGKTTIIDHVSYKNLVVGKRYTISGVLMDKDTGKPLVASGKQIAASAEFVAETKDGTIDLVYKLDASDLAGATTVVYENLYHNKKNVTSHADINDEEQTIHYPKIGTTASDGSTKDHVGTSAKDGRFVDTVKYENLIIGKSYTVKGTLMDKETGKAIEQNGKAVTAETSFTATAAQGSVDLTFVYDSSVLEGKTTVAYEKLYHNEKDVARHEDINDAGQTVQIPKIQTTATSVETGDQVGTIGKEVQITDVVSYKNLVVGKEYTISGKAMIKPSGSEQAVPAKDKDGKDVVQSVTFKATKANGEVSLTFTLDSSNLKNRTVVIFEELLHNGVTVTTHADINDDKQSVYFPEIRTNAVDKQTNDGVGTVGKTTIIDHVSYKNLVVGKRYTISGVLMDKDTGKPLVASGKQIAASAEFVAETKDGTIDLVYKLDASDLAGATTVVYENLYHNKKNVTSHADINDEEQTIHYPKIGTTASDGSTKDHVGTSAKDGRFVDTVKYENLIIGKSYTVKGTLMDKDTGKAITQNGKEITSEMTFTATKTSGTVNLLFNYDSNALEGKTAVAFEKLFHNDIDVARHEDISDENQSVHIPKIHTTATDASTNDKEGVIGSTVTIKDVVRYENLIPGKEYTVKGSAMVNPGASYQYGFRAEYDGLTVGKTYQVTGTAVDADGNDIPELRCSGTLTPTEASGTVIATINSSETLKDANPVFTFVISSGSEKYTYTASEMSATGAISGIRMATDAEGNNVTSEKTFVPEKADGEVTLEFVLDSTQLQGNDVVIFEDLYHNGVKVTSHADMKDDGQTVHYPEIHTTNVDQTTDDHQGAVSGQTTLVDTVQYRNLIVGHEYTVTGKLMKKVPVKNEDESNDSNQDAETPDVPDDSEQPADEVTYTEEPVLVNGKEVTASTAFTAETKDGSVDVVFVFDAESVAGETVVAFEDLSYKGIQLTTHADINDENQTVYLPDIHTSAVDAETGIKNSYRDGHITITDTVTYENLIPGNTYVLKGSLQEKVEEDGEITYKAVEAKMITSENDEETVADEATPVTGQTTFVPEAANGTVDVIFTFDGTELEDVEHTYVAFEDLYYQKGDDEIIVREHKDINDAEQTVYVPHIQTEVQDTESKSHNALADEKVTLEDTVSYEGLIPGKEYTMTGTLMDKETGKALLVNDKEVTAETKFVPEKADGTVVVTFTFDATGLEGKTLVAFETCTYEGKNVAVHADINDEKQTIYVPELHTTATDKADGDKQLTSKGTLTVVDKIAYKNLIPGQKYTVTGVLMDKATKSALVIGGKEVTATKTFVPNKADGTVEIEFTFKGDGLESKTLVAFETISTNDSPVGEHKDINDTDQTVTLTPPPIPAVQTGDTNTMPILAVVTAVLVVLGAGLFIATRKKKNKK